MSVNRSLVELFDREHARYEVMSHADAFTAQEVAQRTHVSGRHLAKVVVVRDAAGAYLMAVVPASQHVDLHLVHHVTGRAGLQLAGEDEIRRLFTDCELGAMPPFGHLYGMAMVVDACLATEDIYFQAGNHHEVVRMDYQEFKRVARPFMADVCIHHDVVHAG